jgi:hypothetical protein
MRQLHAGAQRHMPQVRYVRVNDGVQLMNRNVLYLIIVVLVIGAGVLGYQLYQERKQPDGVQINLGKDGVSIEKK